MSSHNSVSEESDDGCEKLDGFDESDLLVPKLKPIKFPIKDKKASNKLSDPQKRSKFAQNLEKKASKVPEKATSKNLHQKHPQILKIAHSGDGQKSLRPSEKKRSPSKFSPRHRSQSVRHSSGSLEDHEKEHQASPHSLVRFTTKYRLSLIQWRKGSIPMAQTKKQK